MSHRPCTRPRPPPFRALGQHEPPVRIRIGGLLYELREQFKHDSWAATALYAPIDNSNGLAAVCKFHRIAPLFGLSLYRFGVWMAAHERRLLTLSAGLPAVPRLLPEVSDSSGQVIPYAVAREYIPGRPLQAGTPLPPGFFDQLRHSLVGMHQRGVA
jgi:hypothetical protein